MAIMNPSKLRNVLLELPFCDLSETKKNAIEAIITRYLNGDIVAVVHCKDCCRWHDPFECPMCFLEDGDYTFEDGLGFCDRGERTAE